MGMTINEIIEELEETKDYPASDPASDEALNGAIATMRKYQKIQEILKDDTYYEEYGSNAERFIVSAISEVLEDGNDD